MAALRAVSTAGGLRPIAGVSLALVLLFLSVVAAMSATFSTEPLTIVKADGTTHHFTVEIAADANQRGQGLMNRKEMAADSGMLFDFGTTRPVYMWMKNTYLPLDMLFLDADGKIVSIAADTVPFSESIIDSRGPVRFVIELNAGRAKALGIAVGDRAESVQIKASQINP
jgi:uncharacterized membrane protein (UPF0127 family)